VRHLCRHANAFAQRGVGVDGFADVHGVCAHFDGQRDLANHVARVRAHHAAAENLAVAVGLGRKIRKYLFKFFERNVVTNLMKKRRKNLTSVTFADVIF
jgi:hypothetical protein